VFCVLSQVEKSSLKAKQEVSSNVNIVFRGGGGLSGGGKAYLSRQLLVMGGQAVLS